NILLMLNPINKEIIKFDLYTNNQSSIPFNSTPEDMTLTKDGSLYVSSPQGVLNSVNIETGSISPYNTNLDISGIKYANDEIYILEKNSKSMSIFNINKKELKKEKIDLGTVTKEITFFNE
ncbi:MAG: hypothetical protein H7263_18940, partial [Candidatus Sericytochromatia bacterium]|nr:hypothetical protein [Candidatus Sericytochromatia bacterium]